MSQLHVGNYKEKASKHRDYKYDITFYFARFSLTVLARITYILQNLYVYSYMWGFQVSPKGKKCFKITPNMSEEFRE